MQVKEAEAKLVEMAKVEGEEGEGKLMMMHKAEEQGGALWANGEQRKDDSSKALAEDLRGKKRNEKIATKAGKKKGGF